MNIPSHAEAAFISCTFGMLGLIAHADGRVSRLEESFVENYLSKELKFDRKRRALAMKIFREAKDSPLEMRDYANRFRKELGNRIPLRDTVVEVLISLSIADGRLDPEEDTLIRSAALLLDLSESAYEGMKRKYIRPEQELQ